MHPYFPKRGIVIFRNSVSLFSETSVFYAQYLCILIFRKRCIANFRLQIFERQFSITAMKIRNDEIRNQNALLESMKTIIPSDERFQEAFQTLTISNSSIAKYLLSTIENYRRNTKGSDLIPNNDETIVNLEHILPKNLTVQWPEFNEEEHKLFFKRLGNMTILNSLKNSRIGNKSFIDKIAVFSGSDFIITKEITLRSVWNKDSINDRQINFALDAIKCWKMK